MAKICNNLILGISMAGVSEAFALGLSLGIDPKKLANIVNTSSGRHSALALCSSRRPHAHQYISTVITHARHDGPQAWHLATTCSANNIRRWQVLELGHVQPMPWRDGKRACLARIHRRLRLRLDGEGRSRYTRGTRTRTHMNGACAPFMCAPAHMRVCKPEASVATLGQILHHPTITCQYRGHLHALTAHHRQTLAPMRPACNS